MKHQKFSSRFISLFNRTSLRTQLLSRSLLILAILLLLIGLFQYLFMQEFIFRNKAASIKSQIMSLPRDAWSQTRNTKENHNSHPPRFFIPDSTWHLLSSMETFP